jgi:hypothetical protein
MSAVPFEIQIPAERLDDLAGRLAATRWPEDVANDDWSYGANGAYLEELTAYWRDDYDWRARERAMNEHAHFRTLIDEVPIHFVHEGGVGPSPMPLILTHGWPWTFWDFRNVIGPLSNPAAYGGDPEDA